jgi:hypothetical protein
MVSLPLGFFVIVSRVIVVVVVVVVVEFIWFDVRMRMQNRLNGNRFIQRLSLFDWILGGGGDSQCEWQWILCVQLEDVRASVAQPRHMQTTLLLHVPSMGKKLFHIECLLY